MKVTDLGTAGSALVRDLLRARLHDLFVRDMTYCEKMVSRTLCADVKRQQTRTSVVSGSEHLGHKTNRETKPFISVCSAAES